MDYDAPADGSFAATHSNLETLESGARGIGLHPVRYAAHARSFEYRLHQGIDQDVHWIEFEILGASIRMKRVAVVVAKEDDGIRAQPIFDEDAIRFKERQGLAHFHVGMPFCFIRLEFFLFSILPRENAAIDGAAFPGKKFKIDWLEFANLHVFAYVSACILMEGL